MAVTTSMKRPEDRGPRNGKRVREKKPRGTGQAGLLLQNAEEGGVWLLIMLVGQMYEARSK